MCLKCTHPTLPWAFGKCLSIDGLRLLMISHLTRLSSARVNKMRMQKRLYDEGRTSSLNEKKIEALEDIGFDWGKRKGDILWEQKFQQLLSYKNAFGDCHVPIKWPQDRTLGRWVSTQRKEYKNMKENKRTLMSEDRLRRLQEIGFAWTGTDSILTTGDRLRRFRSIDFAQTGADSIDRSGADSPCASLSRSSSSSTLIV